MTDFILNYGLFAIMGLLFVDDLGIPLPGGTLIFSAAVLARTNDEISICSIFAIALIIPPIANSILFYWGRNGARKWLKTHGHKIFLPTERLKKAETFFEKYGEKTVFFAALVSGIRAVSSIIAGSLKMNPIKFFLFHCIGVFIWAIVFVGSGYFLGESVHTVVSENYKIAIGFAIFLIFIKISWGKFQKKIKK